MASGARSRSTTSEQLTEYRRKRDFDKTREPAGTSAPGETGALRFVIQKHAATRLHYDLRLELDGVMKSWAVPKGPSLDPSVKRLAMEVEDHPIEYNTFEGTIPAGEYGGGTVMLWDRGTYSGVGDTLEEQKENLRKGHARGDMKICFHGERLQGSFALVRMRTSRHGSTSDKPEWLLIKHRDEYASAEDITEEHFTSIDTGRTMEQIATGNSRVWHSNREERRNKPAPAQSASNRSAAMAATLVDLEPMYASVGTVVPSGEGWTFEPKYDGVRVLAFVTAEGVKLVTRNGHDKATQFPEVAEALQQLATTRNRDFVVDGEIVALVDGEAARFQELQSRMHVKEPHMIERHRIATPSGIVLFDVLMVDRDVLVREPWTTRRNRLLKLIGKTDSPHLRVTESFEGDGGKMLDVARERGWEGVIAKRTDARYEPGVRSRNWLKLKVEFRQEFVVGGYTEPRNTRQHFGALLLGYFDRDRLIYVGHTGGGFNNAGLAAMGRRLKRLERKTSPFAETPKTNERPHWVEPEIVVEVKFSEWTSDGKLRQPIYLGTRDDKDPRDVEPEPQSVQNKPELPIDSGPPRRAASGASGTSRARRRVHAGEASAKPRESTASPRRTRRQSALVKSILEELDEIQERNGDGTLHLGDETTVSVTSLGKVFFPKRKYTKGDLMRYYAAISRLVLPVMADRPLVLKRFPNGVESESFYQQNAGDTPPGVRVDTIRIEGGSTNRRIVGGDLATLLYILQLGSISVDPWHSRVQSLDFADYTILDLDPGPRATFQRVIQVARWVRETMDSLGLHGALKTSGSSGLHVYIPLPANTPNEAATLVAQIIATRVADAHPKVATIERAVKARGATTVYVDYLQNIIGKTVAGAYSVRANADAMVSTPLTWDELTDDLDPREFTMQTAPARFASVGDIWAKALKKKNSLKALV